MRDRWNHADGQYYKVLTDRLRGPGGLYNIGNVIAFSVGLVAQVMSASGQMSVLGALRQYAFGNPAASWLTLAILTFILAGEFYHRAWGESAPRKDRLVQAADGISALAAVFLSFSLASSGNLMLAIVAGVLLAGGKLGSAVLPALRLSARAHGVLDQLCRWVVVASRVPSLLALGLQILRLHVEGALVSQGFLPVTMVLCFLLWVAADLALMRAPAEPKQAQAQTRAETSHDML